MSASIFWICKQNLYNPVHLTGRWDKDGRDLPDRHREINKHYYSAEEARDITHL